MQGLSTRSVDDLVKAMGMTGVSKSQVSRLCADINERVTVTDTCQLADNPHTGIRQRVEIEHLAVRRSCELQGRRPAHPPKIVDGPASTWSEIRP